MGLKSVQENDFTQNFSLLSNISQCNSFDYNEIKGYNDAIKELKILTEKYNKKSKSLKNLIQKLPKESCLTEVSAKISDMKELTKQISDLNRNIETFQRKKLPKNVFSFE